MPQSTTASAQTLPAPDRIRELSEINTSIPQLLSSAAQAVHALTNRPLPMPGTDDEDEEDTRMIEAEADSLAAQKASFETHSTAFLISLQSVFAKLRRQAYALEEAGIIAPDPLFAGHPKQQTVPPGSAGSQRSTNVALPPSQRLDPERIKNGGLGTLDVGWLNSRGNRVGEEKEGELMKEARGLAEEVLKNRGD